MKTYRFRFDGADGTRLDKFLAERVPALSRTQLRKIIDKGGVHINRKRCKIASRPLGRGADIDIAVEDAASEYEFENSRIIFEDKNLVVCDKPAGIPAQSTRDPNRANFHIAVRDFLAKRAGIPPAEQYLALHHRLDRDTTGVMLFTKTKTRNKEVTDAFRDRLAEKEYLAVVEGSPPAGKFESKKRISERSDKRGAYAAVAKGGNSAHTEFEVVARGETGGAPIALVRAFPKTGRTHQIRVHLADLGFPILGDSTYGARLSGAPRALLHAQKLKILDREFTAPVPADFCAVFPDSCVDSQN